MRRASRRNRDQAAGDAETVARLRSALTGYLAGGGPGAAVPVTHLLDLLNPRGAWSRDQEPPAVRPPAPPGEADPLTGCRPATPPAR